MEVCHPGLFLLLLLLTTNTYFTENKSHPGQSVTHTLLTVFFFLSFPWLFWRSQLEAFFFFFFLFSFFFFLQIAAFFIPVFDSMSTSKLCMKHASFLLKRETLSKVWPPPPPPQLPPPLQKKKNFLKKTNTRKRRTEKTNQNCVFTYLFLGWFPSTSLKVLTGNSK